MTGARYEAYCRVGDFLALPAAAGLTETEHELLRDHAEGMLLTRDVSPGGLEDLVATAAVALNVATSARRLTRAAATGLWCAICACGPPACSRLRLEGPEPAPALQLRA